MFINGESKEDIIQQLIHGENLDTNETLEYIKIALNNIQENK